ncbi:class I SAM-dependent methyltransferase [Consotaella salsifontis]|uniref:Methyltransferase domain-containing protein n=1 Tax=Consotaella salsifontis TaxID=1365950 RepID=A0A1T4P157_9HYPH|nr:class I SAM-dependent methyltransferase [Consotaella salsifontis]SJZ85274.1 Methyltransferase domain-containing protein [Consotaella salsifontis]
MTTNPAEGADVAEGKEGRGGRAKEDRVLSYALPVTLMRPERLVEPPPWVGHIPFAFWIIDALRPRRFVELGTHSGNSFAAFVQAADALGLDGEYNAIDHWRGDEQAGFYGDQIYESLKQYFQARFPRLAKLMRSSFDDAAGTFEERTIDLLHIDGLHTYEAVKHDFENWLPKMSERGVVLLHDSAVRRGDFGVYKLVDELRQKYDVFEFQHSHGLAVIRVGERVPPLVDALLHARPDVNSNSPQAYFGRLGNALVQEAHSAIMVEHLVAKEEVEESLARVINEERLLRERRDSLRSRTDYLLHIFVDQLGYDPAVQKAEAAVYEIAASPYFDEDFYRSVSGQSEMDRLSLARHYITRGEKAGLHPSSEFDPTFYASRNPDLAGTTLNLLLHYIQFGLREGRQAVPALAVDGTAHGADALTPGSNDESAPFC